MLAVRVPVHCSNCADDLDGLPWWLQLLTIAVGLTLAFGLIVGLGKLVGRSGQPSPQVVQTMQTDPPAEPPPPRRYRTVYVNREEFYSLEVEDAADRYWVTFPVSLSAMIDVEEAYEVDHPTFDRFLADPAAALAFVTRARNRELDHLLRDPPYHPRGKPW